ncbi:MAG: DNA replication and repair protein RecF, partial [bacterium]|nr:DNA replication and repair protein RecF [bacterium]
MLLKQITLFNFRNYEKAHFSFNSHLTIVIGENAKGKTNILEGIYFVINGNGFRESKEEELIYFEKNQAYVEGIFKQEDDKQQFKILLNRNFSIEKHYFLNKTRKPFVQYSQEQIKAILFTPEQIDIVIGAPAIRRKYFDKIISFYDYEYKKKLDNYDNALRRRNKIFETYKIEEKLKEELVFWNEYLIIQAKYISQKRKEYVSYLNQNQKLDSKEFSIEYLENELTQKKLDEVFEMEKRMRRTCIGPQKDDYQISLKSTKYKNIHHYGSRSEQRMGIFWLKLNEIEYFEKVKKKKPILLLDDVFSELDMHNKQIILDLILKYQTVITTTEKEIVNMAQG